LGEWSIHGESFTTPRAGWQNGGIMIQPYLVGSGNAAGAMAKCLAMIPLVDSSLQLAPIRKIARGEALPQVKGNENLLILANPHGLHTEYVVAGEAAGFRTMVCEKPAAVRPEDLARLAKIQARVSICHGYRQTWGPQTLKAMLDAGELGEIVALEGRYWQSSASQRTGKPSWKNDQRLNGPHDVLVDLGAHWVD
jgi:predicted dehydrogenase